MNLDERIEKFCEYWRKFRCPSCNDVNWVYDSHSERAYPEVKNAVKCHCCKTVFWVGTKDDFLAYHGPDLAKHDIDYIFENCVDYAEGKPGGNC